MRSIVWNPQLVAVWNRHEVSHGIRRRRHGIKNEGERRYTASRDAIRGRAAIPYNSLRELMPYQAIRSWINKKTNRSSSFYFGGTSSTKVEALNSKLLYRFIFLLNT